MFSKTEIVSNNRLNFILMFFLAFKTLQSLNVRQKLHSGESVLDSKNLSVRLEFGKVEETFHADTDRTPSLDCQRIKDECSLRADECALENTHILSLLKKHT